MDTDSDYEIIKRTADESGKYAWIKFVQPDVDLNKAIVVSHADMQFKFSPAIYQKFLQKIQGLHLGYPNTTASFWQALQNWIQTRYHPSSVINQHTTLTWNNTITAIHGVLENLTQPKDQVLILCPVYYFFLLVSAFKDRKMVQFGLDERDGRFWIDFQKLEELVKKSNIKLFIFCSPWNPCGRIWTKQELGKLVELAVKYKFYILSDQIYSDSIQPTEEQEAKGETIRTIFTSLLAFPEVYPYLVYVSSYTKAFNSSGLPLSYSICYDSALHKKMDKYRMLSGSINNALSARMLEVIYTSEQARKWKKNTIKYIMSNFALFKAECKKKLPKLIIYQMQCSYLCLVDFKAYNLAGQKLKQKFTQVSVCPTFMEPSYVTQADRSLIRLNLAANEKIIVELVERMRTMIDGN